MTICIAALCDQGRSAVVAADRMAVFGSGSLLEFKLDDHANKIYKLWKRAVLLHSGLSKDAEEIREKSVRMRDAAKMAGTMDELLMELIQERRSLDVSRRLGSSYDFEKLVLAVGNAQAGPLFDVLQQVRKVDLGEMLVVAWTSDQYEITFHGPPAFPVRADLHYATVGSGGIYARAALTIQQYNRNAKVSEALFQVYSAKKAAELVYGVGEPTDMAVLTEHGIVDVQSETVALLEEFRQQKSQFMLTSEQSNRLRESVGDQH